MLSNSSEKFDMFLRFCILLLLFF